MTNKDETVSVAPPTAPAPGATPPPVVVPVDMDETVPGGAYVVGGQTVDAEGQPVTTKRRV